MATDVKLDQGDGSFLDLEARVVRTLGSDFMLDASERRKGISPHRRALVHDQGDGLTVNFDNDYVGGVTLVAVREISPHGKRAQTKPAPSKGTGLEAPPTDQTPTLVVRGGISFEVHTDGLLSVGGDGGGPKVATFVLHEELAKLRNQVSDLQTKLTALEARLK